MSVSRRLDELRHPEVEAYLDSSETPTALIPVGTTEQHGPHLPMGTDSMIPTEICERIAEDTDALVGPPINYGASDMHAGYEGITYPHRTLATVVRDLAYSLAESGFTDIVFISGHLTNDWAAKVGANQASHDLPARRTLRLRIPVLGRIKQRRHGGLSLVRRAGMQISVKQRQLWL